MNYFAYLQKKPREKKPRERPRSPLSVRATADAMAISERLLYSRGSFSAVAGRIW